jgi:hypothetical protein
MLTAITFHRHPILLSFQDWNSIKFGSMCYLLLQQGPQTQETASRHEYVKISRMFLFLHNTFTLIQINQGKLVVNKHDFLKWSNTRTNKLQLLRKPNFDRNANPLTHNSVNLNNHLQPAYKVIIKYAQKRRKGFINGNEWMTLVKWLTYFPLITNGGKTKFITKF